MERVSEVILTVPFPCLDSQCFFFSFFPLTLSLPSSLFSQVWSHQSLLHLLFFLLRHQHHLQGGKKKEREGESKTRRPRQSHELFLISSTFFKSSSLFFSLQTSFLPPFPLDTLRQHRKHFSPERIFSLFTLDFKSSKIFKSFVFDVWIYNLHFEVCVRLFLVYVFLKRLRIFEHFFMKLLSSYTT